MLIRNHQLSQRQINQLNALADTCHRYDGNSIPIYSDSLLKYRRYPCNLLFYERHKLIGFLSAFFFYEDACEITLMVAPEWRGKHVAAELMSTIMPYLEMHEVEFLMFPSPHHLNDNWFAGAGLKFCHSEVQMQWAGQTIPDNDHPYHIQQATQQDLADLVNLDRKCFHTQNSVSRSHFQALLKDDQYVLFVLKHQQKTIGKAHLHRSYHRIILSDVAILPPHRGHGIAQALVRHCIQCAGGIKKEPLQLDVRTDNQDAFHIYEKYDFKIINTWDFWKLPTKDILKAYA